MKQTYNALHLGPDLSYTNDMSFKAALQLQSSCSQNTMFIPKMDSERGNVSSCEYQSPVVRPASMILTGRALMADSLDSDANKAKQHVGHSVTLSRDRG